MSDDKTRSAKVLKPFLDPAAGRVVQIGENVDVTEERHKQLALNGLVDQATGPAAKAKPAAKPAPKALTSNPKARDSKKLV